MSPLATVLMIGSFALGYILLSAEIVGAHTDKDLLPRRWLGLEERPNRRRRGWLVFEVLILVAAVSLTQWATATLAFDETTPIYMRLLAGTEIVVASAWTVYAMAVLRRADDGPR